MNRLCVFCGSSPGHDPVYAALATQLGHALAQRGIGLVYGGGRVGLMGVLADATMAAGGEVIGVIPKALMDREHGHGGVTDLRVVDSMHERKALMAELADGFVALPGGIGTLEEIFEVWTWAQLGIHQKPCGLLDVGDFFSPLVHFLDQVVSKGFLSPEARAMLTVAGSTDELFNQLADYEAPAVAKWVTSAQA